MPADYRTGTISSPHRSPRQSTKEGTTEKKSTPPKDPNLLFLEEDLQRYFGTAVNINRRGSRGKIEIEFYSNDDLERVLELLRSREF